MPRTAQLTRMILADHECPYGVRAKELLDQAGYEVEEHVLRTRAEVDAYEEKLGVDATPQIFIDGKRIGGARELEEYLAEHSNR